MHLPSKLGANILVLSFLFIIGSGPSLAQKIKWKLQQQDTTYQGTMNPPWYDKIQLYIPSQKDYDLEGAYGYMDGSRFGRMDFEIDINITGTEDPWMLKTPNGWYPLEQVQAKSQELRMRFDWGFRPALRKVDLKILEQTQALLENWEHWNQEDERDCIDDQNTGMLSLYCALRQASQEVFGDFNHRGAALNVLREEIDKLKPQAQYTHQLMEFNNTCTWDELQTLLQNGITEAQTRLEP